MERADLVQHTSKRFNADLEKVLANALQMAQNVERQFHDSIKALVTADATLAARVVQGDDQVNDMEREIMAECQTLLATRAPAAGDLRLLLALLKMVGDVERMGDECKKIALVATQLTPNDRQRGKFREIRHLARVVQQMVHQALAAFERLDADAAWKVMRMDRAIDTEYESKRTSTYQLQIQNEADCGFPAVQKDPKKAAWYFGHADVTNVVLSVGRDIVLAPKQQGKPVNFLGGPYVEVDGQPFDVPSANRTYEYEAK